MFYPDELSTSSRHPETRLMNSQNQWLADAQHASTVVPYSGSAAAKFSTGADQEVRLIPSWEPFWHQLIIKRPRTPTQMVEVYNGTYCEENYVRKVPVQLLVRFSKKAAEAFPKPETSYDNLKPAFAHQLPTHVPPPKIFELDVNAPENPTYDAILTALKWMFDFKAYSLFNPPDFGPTTDDFKKPSIDLTHLLDLWQANLAFKLRPHKATENLRKEIYRRVGDQPPALDMIKQVAQFIPVEDSVMTRCITAYHHWYRAHWYSKQIVDEINSFLQTRPDLNTKVIEIFAYQARKYRRANFGKELNLVTGYLDTRTTAEENNATEENSDTVETPAPIICERRRRRRRCRQQGRLRIETEQSIL